MVRHQWATLTSRQYKQLTIANNIKTSSILIRWRRNHRTKKRAATDPFVIVAQTYVMILSIEFFDCDGRSHICAVTFDTSEKLVSVASECSASDAYAMCPQACTWNTDMTQLYLLVCYFCIDRVYRAGRSRPLEFFRWHMRSERRLLDLNDDKVS